MLSRLQNLKPNWVIISTRYGTVCPQAVIILHRCACMKYQRVMGRKGYRGYRRVGDRVAQAAAKLFLEPRVDPHFHPDSYGYRAGKSALDAVGVARQRCWKYNWVIDIDIKGFFDNIDHSLMMGLQRSTLGKNGCCSIVKDGWKLRHRTGKAELQIGGHRSMRPDSHSSSTCLLALWSRPPLYSRWISLLGELYIGIPPTSPDGQSEGFRGPLCFRKRQPIDTHMDQSVSFRVFIR